MYVRQAFPRTELSGSEPDPQWAWKPFAPSQPQDSAIESPRPQNADKPAATWDLKWAGHLLRRLGCGPTWPELQQVLQEGPQKALDRLLKVPPDMEAFTRQMDEWESSANTLPGIRAWWLRRFLETPHPLMEKMTLFWHGHLALGNVRSPSEPLVRDYLRTLRNHALGRLDTLLRAVVLHPAMLLSLGAEANRKAQPSAHFARVVLEHCTVGPGQFKEKDVHQVARALTGWFVFRDQLRFIDREYDSGPKELFGQSRAIGADELFRILAEQPATAKTLVRKLYRFFVSEADSPSDAFLEPLAALLAKGAEIASVVETMLRSNWFFSTGAYRRRIKSPVEWALGVVRPMETQVPTEPLGQALVDLGQALGTPPTPAGWPGSTWWITPALLLLRAQWVEQCWTPQSPYGQKLDPAKVATQHTFRTPNAQTEFLLNLYLQNDLPKETRLKLLEETKTASHHNPTDRLRHLAQTLVLLPEFHLA